MPAVTETRLNVPRVHAEEPERRRRDGCVSSKGNCTAVKSDRHTVVEVLDAVAVQIKLLSFRPLLNSPPALIWCEPVT